MILNEEKYRHLSDEAVSLAKAILRDEGDYLSNVYEINSLCFELGKNEFDEDFKIFVAINSETDHLPYGPARESCSKEWLAQCDEELSEIKKVYRGQIEKSCKSIINRFGRDA